MLEPGGLILALGASLWLGLFRATGPRLNRRPLDRQAAAYACGVAALEAVLAYDGQGFSEDELSRELKADPVQGTRWDPMARFARAKGLAVDVRERMTIEDLDQALGISRRCGFPGLAWPP